MIQLGKFYRPDKYIRKLKKLNRVSSFPHRDKNVVWKKIRLFKQVIKYSIFKIISYHVKFRLTKNDTNTLEGVVIYISHKRKKGRSRRNKQNIANGTYGNLRGVRCVISSFSHLIKSLLVCSITLYKRYDARINKIENRKKIVMKIVNAENKVKDFKSFQEMMIRWIWEDINPYFIHINISFAYL